MFDRKNHIEMLKSAMPNWSVEKIEAETDIEERRYSKVKQGDRILHINHGGPILSAQDFESIEKILKPINYELSRYDTSGRIMASVMDDMITGVTLYLNQVTVREAILLGLGTNALDYTFAYDINVNQWKVGLGAVFLPGRDS